MTRITLGRSIKLCRTNQGLSQEDLAKKCGLSASYISLIEKGDRDLPISVAGKIATALGIPMSLLTFMAAEPGDLRGVPEDVRDKLAGIAFKLLNARQHA